MSAMSSNQSFVLSHQTYGDEQGQNSPIILLHGLVGSTLNWREFCKSYSKLAGRKCIAIDCRNHGQSPRSDLMTWKLMAGDIALTLKQLDIPKAVVIGHSMGGMVAMELALSMPSIVEKLIVEDVGPFSIPPPWIPVLLTSMVKMDLTQVENKTDADDILKKSISFDRLRTYVLVNLHKNDNGTFYWGHSNLNGVQENMENLTNVNLGKRQPYQGGTIFIGGDQSALLKNVDMNKLKQLFPNCELQMIPDVGHFVHEDNLTKFLEIVHKFLQ